jgi:hypothetical protein
MYSLSTTLKSANSAESTANAPMTSYLDQKQAWGSENQGMTGQGFEFKNRPFSMGHNNGIQTLVHSVHI